MHRLALVSVLTLVLGATEALAECNNVGCVRPTNGLEELAKTAKHALSVIRIGKSVNAAVLCGTGNCGTEPTLTRLPENCGRAGCATPKPKARQAVAPGNNGARMHAATRVTETFAAVAEGSSRLPPTVAWAQWAERWGFGGLYKASAAD